MTHWRTAVAAGAASLLTLAADDVRADAKKYLLCNGSRDVLFPEIVSALSEKWTITSANDRLYLLTATKEDVKGKLLTGEWASPDAVVNVILVAGPEENTFVAEIKATRNRSRDAQRNLIKYLPQGTCFEFR